MDYVALIRERRDGSAPWRDGAAWCVTNTTLVVQICVRNGRRTGCVCQGLAPSRRRRRAALGAADEAQSASCQRNTDVFLHPSPHRAAFRVHAAQRIESRGQLGTADAPCTTLPHERELRAPNPLSTTTMRQAQRLTDSRSNRCRIEGDGIKVSGETVISDGILILVVLPLGPPRRVASHGRTPKDLIASDNAEVVHLHAVSPETSNDLIEVRQIEQGHRHDKRAAEVSEEPIAVSLTSRRHIERS